MNTFMLRIFPFLLRFTPQRPTTSDPEAWKSYWQTHGQPWRTQPEIDVQQQKQLSKRRLTKPNIEYGIYPFKDIEPKLRRADIEWLLATHDNGRGPVDWSDESQRKREGLDLRGTDLSQEDLSGLPLACMRSGITSLEYFGATEEQRNRAAVCMEKANLEGAQLQKANLVKAQLQGADLGGTQLQDAHLYEAQLQGANLQEAQLDGVRLNRATLSDEKYGPARLVDIRWGEINLAVVEWTLVKRLGDEHLAHRTKYYDDYRNAVRANRQLAVVLRDQGLNEEADHFAYRAQRLQRIVSRKQRKYGRYLFSGFLDLLAGYGYKPIRSVIAYLVIIFGFMGLYLLNAYFIAPHLTWDEALVLSVSSFHGRGFFTQSVKLGDMYARLATFEAVVGLFIEISFISTFTQRFFGK